MSADLATLEQALCKQSVQAITREPSCRSRPSSASARRSGKLVDVKDAARSIRRVIEDGANPTIKRDGGGSYRFSDEAVGELVAQANRSLQTPFMYDSTTTKRPAPQAAGWFV